MPHNTMQLRSSLALFSVGVQPYCRLAPQFRHPLTPIQCIALITLSAAFQLPIGQNWSDGSRRAAMYGLSQAGQGAAVRPPKRLVAPASAHCTLCSVPALGRWRELRLSAPVCVRPRPRCWTWPSARPTTPSRSPRCMHSQRLPPPPPASRCTCHRRRSDQQPHSV